MENDMSGVFERMQADIAEIRVALQALAAGKVQPAVTAPATMPAPAPAAPDAFGMGVAAPAPAPAVQVTNEMITALVQPVLANEAIRGALQQELAAMGIARLPDTRPDQYAEVYNRFKAVIDRHTATAPAAAAPVTGII
jgi:hypothetical protein